MKQPEEMTPESDANAVHGPAGHLRAGWAEASKEIAEAWDDSLVLGEFGNEEDEQLIWGCQ